MECSEWPRSKENQILGYPVKSRGPENLFWSSYDFFMFLKACNGRGTQGSWPTGPRVGRCGWVTQKSQKMQKIENFKELYIGRECMEMVLGGCFRRVWAKFRIFSENL